MSSADYYQHQPQYHHPRHDSYNSRTRDADIGQEKLTAMRDSKHSYYYSSPPSSSLTSRPRKQTWPPSPSVEDETASLTKEVAPSPLLREWQARDGEPPVNTRGTIDQEKLLEDIDLSDYDYNYDYDHHYDYDPPAIPARVSTPYAYTTTTTTLVPKSNAFDDSDTDLDDTTHLRTAERKPARYSFVKSDLHKEDLRTNLYNSQPKPELKLEPKQEPRQHRRQSPPTSRPSSSRGNNTPPSPSAFSTNVHSPSPGRVPIADADWHATYPPPTTSQRSKPPSRMSRHETIPVPHPRIDVQSPSPARAPLVGAVLPYPVDDRPLNVFMPSETHYQFNHSTAASPQQAFPDSPRTPTSSSIPGSPRLRDETYRSQNIINVLDEPARTRRTRANSARSQHSMDDHREQPSRMPVTLDSNKPLPPCPRITATSNYDDWYSLQGYQNFDICPKCYDGVFASTPFSIHFSQTRLGERPIDRFCDFGSPWIRLAWLLTIKQRRPSLEMIYALADIVDIDRPCPKDRELSSDHVSWYGIPDQRDGIHVGDFAICSSDKRMIEALLPTLRGYFTRLPNTHQSSVPDKYMCSLRTSSRRFPKYLDLLVELDGEAQDLGQRPNIHRFIQMARENSFKGECGQGKPYFRKPWYFIPALPEFTVCEECFNTLIWPSLQSRSTPSTVPRRFNKTLQLVPNEDAEVGSSCCLYSPRMKRIFESAVKEADFTYLKRKALERKRVERKVARQKKGIVNWMADLERGSSQWEVAKGEMKALETEWAKWE